MAVMNFLNRLTICMGLCILMSTFLSTSLMAQETEPSSQNDTLAEVTEIFELYKQAKSAGNFTLAIQHAQTLLQINEEVHGHGHPNTFANLDILAMLYEKQGMFYQGEQIYIKWLSFLVGDTKENILQKRKLLRDLTSLYMTSGELDKAEKTALNLLKTQTQRLVVDDTELAQVHRLLGDIHLKQKRRIEAAINYTKAINLDNEILGSDQSQLNEDLNNIGKTLIKNEMYEEAISITNFLLTVPSEAVLAEVINTDDKSLYIVRRTIGYDFGRQIYLATNQNDALIKNCQDILDFYSKLTIDQNTFAAQRVKNILLKCAQDLLLLEDYKTAKQYFETISNNSKIQTNNLTKSIELDNYLQIVSMLGLSEIHYYLGEFQHAESLHFDALEAISSIKILDRDSSLSIGDFEPTRVKGAGGLGQIPIASLNENGEATLYHNVYKYPLTMGANNLAWEAEIHLKDKNYRLAEIKFRQAMVSKRANYGSNNSGGPAEFIAYYLVPIMHRNGNFQGAAQITDEMFSRHELWNAHFKNSNLFDVFDISDFSLLALSFRHKGLFQESNEILKTTLNKASLDERSASQNSRLTVRLSQIMAQNYVDLLQHSDAISIIQKYRDERNYDALDRVIMANIALIDSNYSMAASVIKPVSAAANNHNLSSVTRAQILDIEARINLHEGNLGIAKDKIIEAIEIVSSIGEFHPHLISLFHTKARIIKQDTSLPLNASLEAYESALTVFRKHIGRLSSDGNLIGLVRQDLVSESELRQHQSLFYEYAVEIVKANKQGYNEQVLTGERIFANIQLSNSTQAGKAVSIASARLATTDSAIAKLIKRMQLLKEVRLGIESELAEVMSVGGVQIQQIGELLSQRLVDSDEEIKTIQANLEVNFPDYFALTSPKPVSLKDTQGLLYDNEALVVFLAGDEGTLVFAVTKEKMDWVLVDLDASVLNEAVRVLRASLENPQNAFPRGQAHGIYKKLMDEVEGLVSEKDHLFLVPSGALGSIPLGVLVTDEPQGNDSSPEALRGTKWWGTRQALTTLPSVSSLNALRLLAKDSRGKEPFAGFGNPVLDGPHGDNDKRSANLASRGTASYFRGKYGDVEAIRTLASLPQTETELMSLASAMRTQPELSLWLGDRATEANLKTANLAEKRVLAFATHGLMSGEISGLAEPALVLTPPDEATDLDDGLLTASEAALLNLNADWVILSACNTAAADQPGADGLSGLARSFFYAGARSMLVSHWPVRDDAAARLTTTAIALQYNEPDIGRAEALRRSMLVLMNDKTDPSLAHPSAWAPFVIVGEGGSPVSADPGAFDPNNYKENSSNGQTSPVKLIKIFSGITLLLVFGFWIVVRRKRQTSQLN